MLSVASLLNPINSEPRGTPLPSNAPSSLCISSSSHGSPILPLSSIKKQKMTKDGAVFAKGKIKGEVNFPPFEQFDEEISREVQRFEVYPLGKIQEYCRHIPYNSEKKSFLEKTGRESFEVFQYLFKVPGDDKDYTVMWDYNIGLVRITPFFKCCKYSKVYVPNCPEYERSIDNFKTTPAKMLNMNPGLKEITHSITGGALAAQGYWMPYSCALAVCTTFCSHIAGALIPIFGPSFPSQCVAPEAPEHGRMIIDPSIVAQATAEAEAFRLQYTSLTPKSTPRESYSPQAPGKFVAGDLNMNMGTTPISQGRRLRLKRTHAGKSPYGTPTNTDGENGSETSSADGYFCTPGTPGSLSQQSWAPRNMISHSANSSINISPVKGPNPWLSAIPRSVGLVDITMSGTWQGKRCADEADADDEYDGEESVDEKKSVDVDDKGSDCQMEDLSMAGAEKKAAWLLMKLSVKDGESCAESTREVVGQEKDTLEGPRVKRQRATSM